MFNILSKVGRVGAVCCCYVCRNPYEVNDRFAAQQSHAGDQCPSCKNLPSNPPTQALLHQVYDYNAFTGALSYKRDFSRRIKGDNPTSSATNGYLVLTMDKTYLAHRIIWLMQTGAFPEFVDHVNHTRNDNCWGNLTLINKQGNAQNKSINLNNTSGYLGVSYMPRLGKYRATLTHDKKQIHIGVFATAEAAHEARLAANPQYDFHANHGTP